MSFHGSVSLPGGDGDVTAERLSHRLTMIHTQSIRMFRLGKTL